MKYRLGDICTITKGETGIMKAIPGEYTMVALGEADKTHNEFQFDCNAVIIPLVSSTGHGHASMKRVKYKEGKFALGNILCAVIPKDESFVLAKYLHIYLHWNREELLVSQMRGMANVSLPMNKIADVEVIVPSIEKQRQIVELEKELVAKEFEADNLYNEQLTLIENLNQAILQEAVQGKLVKISEAGFIGLKDLQDTGNHPNHINQTIHSSDNLPETGHQLLARIKAEKQLSNKKEKPLPRIKPEEIPFEIPTNWVWCRLWEIINIKSGKRIHASDYCKNGISFLRSGEIGTLGRGEKPSNELFISEKKYKEVKAKFGIPKKGDILIACIGGSIGNTWVVDDREFYYKDGNLVLLESIPEIDTNYLLSYLKSPFFWKNTILNATDSSYNALTIEKLKDAEFPLPPLSEQKLIVAEIERQLSKTKQLKEHILTNQQATEQLLKALLHQAFEVEEG